MIIIIFSIILYIDRAIYRYAHRRVIVTGDANCERLKLRTCIHVLGRERVKLLDPKLRQLDTSDYSNLEKAQIKQTQQNIQALLR